MHVDMRFYNVREATERQKSLRDLEKSVIEDNNRVRRVVTIMGGDGSLGTTIKFLRKSAQIDEAM